ncbi:MAG: histidine kinase [Spirochaetaceae bacterium]|nr:histidine kinase [Spirochaetaceae bacterium]
MRFFKYKKIYYPLISLVICFMVLAISIPPYKRFERFFFTKLEINKIYEKWLIVKSETVKHLIFDWDNIEEPYDLINAVSNYEVAMQQLLNKEILEHIADDPLIFNELVRMILIWQDIQFNLIISIFFKNDIDIFINELLSFIIETDDFEVSMKNTIYFIDRYLDKRIRQNWVLFATSIFFTIFLILLFGNLSYSYLKMRGKEREVRKLSRSMVEVLDNERIRIAADLHDVITQNLLSIKHYCKDILSGNGCDSKAVSKIKKISTIADRNIKAVREISFNLRPPELTDSLCKAIEFFSNEITSKTDIEVKFFPLGFDNYVIDRDLEITIYRLICEAVNNVLKHAHASAIIIKIILFFPFIVIKIEDNGIGFLPDERIRTKEQMGIQGMRDRVVLVEGTMEIKSGKKSGTIVTFKIPCKGLVKENEKI